MSRVARFGSERGQILAALMTSMTLVALDSTIIATAVPSIVHDLHGFSDFPWMFSAYLLAQACVLPVVGRIADLVGRKPLVLLGIGLFFVGSVLCGLAWSLPALIAFRAVQGAGAGVIQAMSTTIVGDLFTLVERATAQGYLASVWGVASIAGPALGGIFAEYLSWRWIFFINIPICLAAAYLLSRRFHERPAPRAGTVDLPGAALLVPCSALALVAILEGGQMWGWFSVTEVMLVVATVALLALFVRRERRTPYPVLPLWVFGRRQLLVTSLGSAGVGGVSYGLSAFVPLYTQNVLHYGPVVAGGALASMTLVWPVSSSQAGKLYLRWGFRTSCLVGVGIATLGAAQLLFLGEESRLWQVAAACLVVGLGMGFVAAPMLIAAQSTVGWHERGVVTASNMFARAFGSAAAVAVLGAVANTNVAVIGESGARNPDAVALACHDAFVGVLAICILTGLCALLVRGGRPQDRVAAAAATLATRS